MGEITHSWNGTVLTITSDSTVYYNDNGTAVACCIYYNNNGSAVQI